MRRCALLPGALLVLLVLIAGCSSHRLQLQHQRSASLAQALQEPGARVALPGLLGAELTLSAPCDSCHGASANFWEFEYDNRLDSLLREWLPQAELVRLVPGVDPVGESDTLVEAWTRILARGSAFGPEACSGIDPELRVEMPRPSAGQRLAATRMGAEWNLQLAWVPGWTRVVLHPKKGQPKGRVEVEHVLTLWDLRRGEPLYLLCLQEGWKAPEGEFDRQTTWPVFRKLVADLGSLLPEPAPVSEEGQEPVK